MTFGDATQHILCTNAAEKGLMYTPFYKTCNSEEIHPSMYPVGAEQLVPRPEKGSGETVDTFPQELRPLFQKAYPPAQKGSEEAETMGHAVLTNQFISGLRPELKSKLAGHQGSFDQLLARARFKEAKQQEFAAERERSSSSRSYGRGSEEWSSTKTPPKNCTWGHRTGAIGGPISGRHTNKRLTGGHLASSHQGKHGPSTVLHVWSKGACA